jgi:hypothetical protein
MSSSTNYKEVFTTVHDAVVAAVVDSTTVDSVNSGGVSGPVVPEMKAVQTTLVKRGVPVR